MDVATGTSLIGLMLSTICAILTVESLCRKQGMDLTENNTHMVVACQSQSGLLCDTFPAYDHNILN